MTLIWSDELWLILGYFTEVTEAETQSKNTLLQVKVHLSQSVKVSVKVLWRSFIFDQMILCFYCQIKVMNVTKSISFFTAGTRSSLWTVEPSRMKLDLRSELMWGGEGYYINVSLSNNATLGIAPKELFYSDQKHRFVLLNRPDTWFPIIKILYK